MKRSLLVLLLAALWLAACSSPAGPVTVPTEIPPTQVPPTGVPTQVPPTETHIPVDIPVAQREAMKALAAALGLSVDEIKLVRLEAVEWPNGCLGVVRPGVMCTQAIVPGFRVVLEAQGQQYEYHTNQDGSIIVQAPAVTGSPDGPAVLAAVKALAEALGIDEAGVKVASSTAIEWPDSCLGVSVPDLACAQMVTPGFLVVLEANGLQSEYHTNADGSAVVPATVALTWERKGGIAAFCDSLTVYLAGEAHAAACPGSAGQGSWDGTLTAAERAQLHQWLRQYGAVSTKDSNPGSDEMVVTLTLAGQSSGQPTDAERQAIEAWAQSVFTRLKK